MKFFSSVQQDDLGSAIEADVLASSLVKVKVVCTLDMDNVLFPRSPQAPTQLVSVCIC